MRPYYVAKNCCHYQRYGMLVQIMFCCSFANIGTIISMIVKERLDQWKLVPFFMLRIVLRCVVSEVINS